MLISPQSERNLVMETVLIVGAMLEIFALAALIGAGYLNRQSKRVSEALLTQKEQGLASREEALCKREEAAKNGECTCHPSGETASEGASQDPTPPVDRSQETASAEKEELGNLERRLKALGLEYSDCLTTGNILEMDEDVRPAHSRDDADVDCEIICSRCGYDDIHSVLADDFPHFHGCLGAYCFSCGNGKCISYAVPPDDHGWNNLFVLVERWEKVKGRSSPDARPVDATVG